MQSNVCQLVSTKPQDSLKHTCPEDVNAVTLELLLDELWLLPTDILSAAAVVDWMLAVALELPPVGIDCATAGVDVEYPPTA